MAWALFSSLVVLIGTSVGARAATTPCDTGGTAPGVLAVIAVPGDVNNGVATSANISTARTVIAQMDLALDEAAGPHRTQTFRWVRDNGTIVVCTRTVRAEGDGFIDIGEVRVDVAMEAPGPRKYLVFVATGAGRLTCEGAVVSGCAQDLQADESPSQQNLNNGTGYSFTDLDILYQASLQEFMHVLGAVQYGAPHSCQKLGFSCGHHPVQSFDTVNRGYPVGPGLGMDCADVPSTVGTIDCGHEDYYSSLCAINVSRCPGPEGTVGPSVYLANNYNIARDSIFLNPPTTLETTIQCASTNVTYSQGDEDSQTFAGSSVNDIVNMLDGNDTVDSFGGADKICGGWLDDTLRGGAGDDTVAGEEGGDILRGGAGNDTIQGGTADDLLYDGDGLDNISGGVGNDTWYPCLDGYNEPAPTGVENIGSAQAGNC
jgi:hypothetical protein